MRVATQVDACHGSVRLQSFSQCPGRRESNMEVDQGWHLWDLMKYKWDTTLSFRLRVSKQQFPLDLGFRANVVYRGAFSSHISCQYPTRKHTRHTTSYHTEWVQVKKQFHPLHSQSTKFENLEMRRMSMSRLQNLSPKLATKTPWTMSSHLESQDTKSLHSFIADAGGHPGRCLSQKCSSSKLQPVPGRRESNMEVDQGWHLWDLMKYKWDTTLSFRLRVSKQQFPLDSRQMWFSQRCISSQYHANIPVESIPGIPHHTTQNEFKSKSNSPTSLTVN